MNVEKILNDVYELNVKDNTLPLSKKQVVNVLNRLLSYPIDSEQQLETALEYSVKMRSEIIFTTNHVVQPYKSIYNYYTNIDYVICRVLKVMNIIGNDSYKTEPTYEDNIIKYMKNSLDLIEVELKEEIKSKIKVLK